MLMLLENRSSSSTRGKLPTTFLTRNQACILAGAVPILRLVIGPKSNDLTIIDQEIKWSFCEYGEGGGSSFQHISRSKITDISSFPCVRAVFFFSL